jgi:hypothetical protein
VPTEIGEGEDLGDLGVCFIDGPPRLAVDARSFFVQPDRLRVAADPAE